MCINTDYGIKGDYNSQAVQHLTIQFEKCAGDDGCADEKEIIQWLKRKFILTLSNEYNFYQGLYSKEKIQQYSKINWYPIDSQRRGEFSN